MLEGIFQKIYIGITVICWSMEEKMNAISGIVEKTKRKQCCESVEKQ